MIAGLSNQEEVFGNVKILTSADLGSRSLEIINSGTQFGFRLSQVGQQAAVDILSYATGITAFGMHVVNTNNVAGFKVSNQVATSGAIANFSQENPSSVGQTLFLLNSGNGPVLQLNSRGSGAHIRMSTTSVVNESISSNGDFWLSGIGLFYKNAGSTFQINSTAI